MTSDQIRAARGLLNWTVRDLAERAGVHRNTVTNLETGKSAEGYSLERVVAALEKAGVMFLAPDRVGGSGVRLKDRRR